MAVTSQTCETKLKKSKGKQATKWRASSSNSVIAASVAKQSPNAIAQQFE